MIWTSGIWKNVSEVSISRHFLSLVFPCVSQQKAVCGWKPGSGFPAEFVRLVARLRITGRPYAQHSVSSQASKAQHPQNKRRENASARPNNVGLPPCEDVRSRRRRWCRTSEPRWDHFAGRLYQIVLDIISSYCITRIANLLRCAQMIASLPHYRHAAASFWAAYIFPVLLHTHTHILSGRQSSTQSGKSLQISVDLDHFPENGLLLPTHWVEGKSRPLSGKSTSQSNCLLGKHIMLAGEHKNEQQRFRRFSSLQNILPPCTKWYCQN